MALYGIQKGNKIPYMDMWDFDPLPTEGEFIGVLIKLRIVKDHYRTPYRKIKGLSHLKGWKHGTTKIKR